MASYAALETDTSATFTSHQARFPQAHDGSWASTTFASAVLPEAAIEPKSFVPSHQKAFSQTARFRLRAITDSQKAPAKINFSSPFSQWCKRKEDMKKSSKTEVSFDQEHNDSPLFGSVSDTSD